MGGRIVKIRQILHRQPFANGFRYFVIELSILNGYLISDLNKKECELNDMRQLAFADYTNQPLLDPPLEFFKE